MPSTLSYPTQKNSYLSSHILLLHNSLQTLTGQNLIQKNESPTKAAQRIFHAPFILLSHNNAPDPVLTYGNRTGLDLYGLTWEELTTMPSRYTAEAPERAERDRLFERVTADGYIDNYAGIRISKSGRRFQIENVTVWNLTDEQGSFCGQAAMFADWTFLAQKA